jgi:hypothetical protein
MDGRPRSPATRPPAALPSPSVDASVGPPLGPRFVPPLPKRGTPLPRPEIGTPKGTPTPLSLYARSGPDLHFFAYAFFPQEDPGGRHPPSSFPPKYFYNQKYGIGSGRRWAGAVAASGQLGRRQTERFGSGQMGLPWPFLCEPWWCCEWPCGRLGPEPIPSGQHDRHGNSSILSNFPISPANPLE